jgi:uncharacterized protein YqfA (UPF0365 family)
MDGLIVFVVIVAVVLLSILMSFIPLRLWISASAAGVHVSFFSLVGMRLRRVKPERIINPMIKGTKAGLNMSVNQLAFGW